MRAFFIKNGNVRGFFLCMLFLLIFSTVDTVQGDQIDNLIKNLDSNYRDLRMSTIWTLGKVDDPRAFAALISALKHKDLGVRIAAAEALGDKKDPKAIDPLIAGLKENEETVSEAFGQALAEITGKEFPDTGNYGMTPYTSWRGGRGSRAVFRYFTLPSGERVRVGDEQDLSLEFKIHSGEGPILWDLDAATTQDIERMRTRMLSSDALESERIGFDPAQGGKIPVAGGGAAGASNAHTAGIWPEDKYCATRIPGLYVAGENCATRY